MPESVEDISILLKKIKSKRHELIAYIQKSEPHNLRLINYSIYTGAFSALLTAGPGVGGNAFVDSMKDIMPFNIPVWQILCFLAAILSVVSVITSSMMKSNNLSTKIDSARSCNAKLEGLETMLELSQINLEEAASLYTQYLTEVPHI